MPHGGAYTIVSSVTTPDDDDILALRVDVPAILQSRVEERSRVQLKAEKVSGYPICSLSNCQREGIPANTPSRNEYRPHRGRGSSGRVAR